MPPSSAQKNQIPKDSVVKTTQKQKELEKAEEHHIFGAR